MQTCGVRRPNAMSLTMLIRSACAGATRRRRAAARFSRLHAAVVLSGVADAAAAIAAATPDADIIF